MFLNGWLVPILAFFIAWSVHNARYTKVGTVYEVRSAKSTENASAGENRGGEGG